MASELFDRHGRRVYLTADKRKACLAVGGEAIRRTRAAVIEADQPTLVDVVAQPLHEACAPASEWIA